MFCRRRTGDERAGKPAGRAALGGTFRLRSQNPNGEDSRMPNETKTLLVTERFRVEQITRTTADGQRIGKPVVRHPGAVAVIPMVDPDHVCLIRNFRMAVGQTLVELPAGTLEAGETPQQTAARELSEETGYRAARWSPLHAFYVSPGILDEKIHLFVAEELSPMPAARQPGEEIENLVLPWDEAVQMVRDGRIHDAKTLVGLLIYDRLRRPGGK